jgi:hypothetical protein
VPSPPAPPAAFVVRAFYTETDSGHLYGPFATRERAEDCAIALAARPGVIRAAVEETA